MELTCDTAGSAASLRPMRAACLAFALSAQTALSCDLALVLAVDVSGSVNPEQYRLQMDGLAEALRDGVVAEALIGGQARLALVQWSGESRQSVTIPWTTITDYTSLDVFTRQVEADPRLWRNYSTAIGEALNLSMEVLESASDCKRRVIDVSGDGESNEGISPRALHPALKARGITVNAIAIEASSPDLTEYFFENVITGEGAFVETAVDFEDYPARIKRKLLRETTKQVSLAD